MVLSNYLQMRAPILILELDENGIVVEANEFARRLLGRDCVGRSIGMMVVDFRRQFDISKLRSHGQGQLISFVTSTASPLSLKATFLPLGNSGILVGEHDQQEAEELQTTLIRLNSELSSISRELQKKTIQLEKSNEMKNHFLGIAAHDLRSPLASIFAYIDLIKDEMKPLKGTHLWEGMDEIHGEVKYMLNLVSNLLDYSVIEQGRLELIMQETNIRELLQHVIHLNSLIASKRDIRLELKIDKEPGDVTFDLNRIRQVLNNLLSNAIKFTPSGGLVSIGLTYDSKEVKISVKDQGKGVPPDELGKLFKPFGRTKTKAESNEKSTGLGLSICKRIVEAHGGRIWEENLPEGGACFSFTLPVTGAENGQTAAY